MVVLAAEHLGVYRDRGDELAASLYSGRVADIFATRLVWFDRRNQQRVRGLVSEPIDA